MIYAYANSTYTTDKTFISSYYINVHLKLIHSGAIRCHSGSVFMLAGCECLKGRK